MKKDTPAPVAPPPVVTPDPYTYNPEVQTSQNISMATYMVSDIDMLISFPAEAELWPKFYVQTSVGSNTVTITRDTVNELLVIAYNNAGCVDGRNRDGAIIASYSNLPMLMRNIIMIMASAAAYFLIIG